LQRTACGFIESKTFLVKSLPEQPQAGRKSTGEEDGKRRKEEILVEGGEEDSAIRKQQFQTGIFTAFSDRRCHLTDAVTKLAMDWNGNWVPTAS
jgi:hypothetical protein